MRTQMRAGCTNLPALSLHTNLHFEKQIGADLDISLLLNRKQAVSSSFKSAGLMVIRHINTPFATRCSQTVGTLLERRSFAKAYIIPIHLL